MSIKFIIFLLFSSTIFHPLTSVFDESPWFIVDNQTAFGFNCQVQAVHYFQEGQSFSSLASNEEYFKMQCYQEHDEQGKAYTKFIFFFGCAEHQTFTFNPIFSCNDVIINPTIVSIFFIQHNLQVMHYHELSNPADRYLTITYDDEVGVVPASYPIPLYIKIASNAQHAVSSLLASIMKLTNSLS